MSLRSSKVLIKDGDFVITFNTELVTSCTTYGKILAIKERLGEWENEERVFQFDMTEHPEVLKQVIQCLSEHFEVIDVNETEEDYSTPTDAAIYRLETTGLATWFKLTFPSQDELDFAKELMGDEPRFSFTPFDSQLYALSVRFAPFYTAFEENRQYLIDVLGEPQSIN